TAAASTGGRARSRSWRRTTTSTRPRTATPRSTSDTAGRPTSCSWTATLRPGRRWTTACRATGPRRRTTCGGRPGWTTWGPPTSSTTGSRPATKEETMKTRTAVLIGMVLLAALCRSVPHPPTFTPRGALALCAGAQFRNRWAAFLVPLAAMLLSDAALEVITSQGWGSGWLAHGTGFYRGMWVVYGAI